MTWLDRPMIAMDTETSGPNPDWARIVTATVVVLTPGQPSWDVATHTWLADPGVEIPAGATAVHGITTERARAEGRPAREVVAEVTTMLGRALSKGTPVVAYNGAFDLTVLDREGLRHGVKTLSGGLGNVAPVLDPHVLDKRLDRFRKGSRKLAATAAHYGVALSEDDAHDATADAMAAVRVLWRMAAKYPELRELTLHELHNFQIRWRAEQAAGLQECLRRTDPAATVNPAWPIQPLPQGWNPEHHPTDDPSLTESDA